MAIKIKRKTGRVGGLFNFNIFIDGEKVKKIKNDEKAELEIPNQEATVQANQMGTKSNKVRVKDGDELELITTSWGKYAPISLVLIGGLLTFIPEFSTRIIGLIIILALYYLIPIVTDTTSCKLKKRQANENIVVSAHSD